MAEFDQKTKKQVVFFGCDLDCDEQYESIQEKSASRDKINQEPYQSVLSLLDKGGADYSFTTLGSIPVPDWLGPFPDVDISELTSERFVNFIDEDGCREYCQKVERLVYNNILPNIPCMIAVDHSLTGGVLKSVFNYYGDNKISLVVMDSHTDAIPMQVMADTIHYDLETNPHSIYDKNDKLLYNRTNSYNASSFIYHLIQEDLIDPNHVYIVGVSDYPPKNAFKIKDKRVKNYVDAYVSLKRKGVKIATKEECLKYPSRLKQMFKKIETPYIYLSIDMDIGAKNALDGVRFRNWKGLSEKQINKLITSLLDTIKPEQLIGMDLTEFNPRRAGSGINGNADNTYLIAAKLLTRIINKVSN